MRKSAEISPCGKYRYHLQRIWEVGAPRVAFVMLNPSTADATEDDPTIRRCIGYAKAWGYGGLDVVNLYAYRATDPAELKRVSSPIGPDNDETLLAVVRQADKVICAWGGHGGRRGEIVLRKLRQSGISPMCLETTKKGEPKHPLYLKADLNPVPL